MSGHPTGAYYEVHIAGVSIRLAATTGTNLEEAKIVAIA